MISDKSLRRYTVAFFLLYGLGIASRFLLFFNTMFFEQTPKIFLVAAILVWIIRIKKSVLEKNVRLLLIVQAILYAFWFVLNSERSRNFAFMSQPLSRMLWYMYYVTMILAPIMGFYVSLCVGKDSAQTRSIIKKHLFVLAIGLVMLLVVLTNDLHMKMFYFYDLSNSRKYSYQIAYYIIVAFIVVVYSATFFITLKKIRISSVRRYSWIPVVLYGLLVLMMILYAFDVFPHVTERRIETVVLSETYVFFNVLIWESYMRIGLIPVNCGYDSLIGVSSFNIRIEDEKGETYLVSESYENVAEKLDEGSFVSFEEAIPNGKISWLMDFSDIQKLDDELEKINESLADENEIIRSKNEISEQESQLEIKTQLYDSIFETVKPQIEEIERIVSSVTADSPDFRKKISHACILNAFVKRNINLFLLSKSNSKIKLEELSWCFRESEKYLRLYGINCHFEQLGTSTIDGELAISMYSFFEAVVEACLEHIVSMNIQVLFRFNEAQVVLDFISDETANLEKVVIPENLFVQAESDARRCILSIKGKEVDG